jgi:ribosomal protein S8
MRALSISIGNIKQALGSKHPVCRVPRTKTVQKFLVVLLQLGYIRGFTVFEKFFLVRLAYKGNKSIIRGLSVYSRSSNRVYHKFGNLRGRALAGYTKNWGVTLYTTSFAAFFLTDVECFLCRLGGEPLVRIV